MMDANYIGCLKECPLQIPIHIRTKSSIANSIAGGMDPGCRARVGGQTRGCREAGDLSDFQKNDNR
jgi:hypothetical protein